MEKKRLYEKPFIELKRVETRENILAAGSAVIWDSNRKIQVEQQKGSDLFDHGTFEVTSWDDPEP